MALGIFTRTCSKNVSGATKLFIAEAANVTAITVTAGEISAVTGTTPFMRVDTEQDSVQWKEVGETVGKNNYKFTNTIDALIAPPAVATNTFLQALIDGSPCGLLAIVIDGNGKCWMVGYNATDIKNRPLRLATHTHDTGKGLSDENGQVIPIQLTNECAGMALPFDSTLSTAINAGTSTIIKWS